MELFFVDGGLSDGHDKALVAALASVRHVGPDVALDVDHMRFASVEFFFIKLGDSTPTNKFQSSFLTFIL